MRTKIKGQEIKIGGLLEESIIELAAEAHRAGQPWEGVELVDHGRRGTLLSSGSVRVGLREVRDILNYMRQKLLSGYALELSVWIRSTDESDAPLTNMQGILAFAADVSAFAADVSAFAALASWADTWLERWPDRELFFH